MKMRILVLVLLIVVIVKKLMSHQVVLIAHAKINSGNDLEHGKLL